MKTTQSLIRNVLFACLALLMAGAIQAQADDHHHYAPYRHDSRGYWDEHHHHHNWVYYNHHRGYWDDRGGAHLWINID